MLRWFVVVVALIINIRQLPAQTVIVDNLDAGFSTELGTWQTGSSTPGMYGTNYRFADTTGGAPTARARFTPNLPLTGYYYISVWYNVGTNRAVNAPYTVHGDLVTSTVLVNQQVNGSQFFYLGQAHFLAGTAGSVSIANNASNLVVMADAVEFKYAGVNPGPEPGDIEQPELRGLWTSRFEWRAIGETEAQTYARIDAIVNAMVTGNFNSLFFQIRGSMDVMYPSPDEPWNSRFSYQPQNYDPLAYALNKAHQAGLKFHAYINTHAISQGADPPPAGLTPPHPFYAHGNPADPAHSDWVFHVSGQPQPLGAGEELYNWTAPGVPGFQRWTRDQVMYVAENYNVDGVHFDRIRFAGSGSTDPISNARSQIGSPSNPDNLSFRDWNRDQITRLLNDMYGAVAELNYNRPPGKRLIEVSTAPFRAPSQQAGVNQMVGAWNAIGAQDFVVPQIYVTDTSLYGTYLQQNLNQGFGRQTVGGMSRNMGGSSFAVVTNNILKNRELGGHGTVIFSYTGFPSSEWAQFSSTVYKTKVPTPDMPWLSNPTDAIIVGNITDLNGDPVLDAQITRNGSTYKWLSGEDGFYSMLKTPASQAVAVTVNKVGLPIKTMNLTPLAPGEVRRVDVVLGNSAVDEWMVY